MPLWEDVRAWALLRVDALRNNPREVAIGAGLFVVSFAGSLLLTGIVLVRLPPDYLLPAARDVGAALPDAPKRSLASRIARNAAGVLLVLVGIVLSFPGVPGQGLLTIACGLLLLDLQVNRRLLRRVVRVGSALDKINRLRARYGKAPLQLHVETPGPAESADVSSQQK